MKFLYSLFRRLVGRKLQPVINTTDDGFEIESGRKKQPVFIFWGDVIKVRSYKLDLITFDELYISVTFLKDQMPWTQEISEEFDGFEVFVARLSKQLRLNPPDWRSRVIDVPFARNELLLFEKNNLQP